MNPTAGSFTINPRLQRHFSVFALSFPGADALETIYSNILTQHLAQNSFASNVQKFAPNVVKGALALHQRVAVTFLPTAIKFHYIFNLRDMSNIFQGVLFTLPDAVKDAVGLVRIWLHEAARVYKDKMVEKEDMELYDKVNILSAIIDH